MGGNRTVSSCSNRLVDDAFCRKASLEKPTSSQQLKINSEMDGTVAGEEMAEEARKKDEKWSQFKDANARGAGNTMNRG